MAEQDLASIFDYTVDTWGWEQSDDYVSQLSVCFQNLADAPELGRPLMEIDPSIRRFERASHVVFFKEIEDWIQILRVLHRSQLPSLHILN
jgi:toxin ParE1/3/4